MQLYDNFMTEMTLLIFKSVYDPAGLRLLIPSERGIRQDAQNTVFPGLFDMARTRSLLRNRKISI